MPSQLETAARRFKSNLLSMERSAASDMVRTYGEAWQRLTPRIDNLSEWIRAQREAGNEVPVWRINQLQDLQDFRRQVETELRQFERYANATTTAAQREAIAAAWSNAADLMLIADPSLATQLVRFSPAAIESFVGFASDGSPLRELFANLGNADAIVDLYVQNLAMGINPRVAARELRRDFAVPLRRALTISRTEMIRAYRAGSMDTYRANATLLDGWVWLSAADRRTCAACLAMHGTVHSLSEDLNDHPQGRCTAVPWVKGRRPAIPSGDEVFRQLPESDQRDILGPTAYDAWSNGDLRIGDMAKVVSNRRWGDSIRRKTLAELGIEDRAPRRVAVVPDVPRRQGPSGTPVSAATDIQATGNVKDEIEAAMAAIDSVHGDGMLAQIPIKRSGGKMTTGEYSYSGAKAMQIKVSSAGKHPRMTTAHEVGHWLDHQQANVALYNPLVTRAMANDPQLVAALKEAKEKYWNAVYASRYYNDLKGLKSVQWVSDGKLIDGAIDRKYIKYLTSKEELWARSYAQYIAERGNDAIMKDELTESVMDMVGYQQQWPRDDFEPIADAIDGIMSVLGWRK